MSSPTGRGSVKLIVDSIDSLTYYPSMNNEAFVRGLGKLAAERLGFSDEESAELEKQLVDGIGEIQTRLIEARIRANIIPVDMNELDESYVDGFETGSRWTESYRPGGPWCYTTSKWESDRSKALAEQSRGEHDAWLQGFDDARAANV